VAQLVTVQAVQAPEINPYPVLQAIAVTKSEAHKVIPAGEAVQATQVFDAATGPLPDSQVVQEAASGQTKQPSPQAVQTLATTYSLVAQEATAEQVLAVASK
jgi:hypothetical protein